MAALDLDGTIISSAVKGKVVDGKPVWEWWRSFVPEKLKKLVDEGWIYLHQGSPLLEKIFNSYAIVIISNQGIKPAALKTWKGMVPLIGEAVRICPFATRIEHLNSHWSIVGKDSLPSHGSDSERPIPQTNAWNVAWSRENIQGRERRDRHARFLALLLILTTPV